jgi:hypothetical protein
MDNNNIEFKELFSCVEITDQVIALANTIQALLDKEQSEGIVEYHALISVLVGNAFEARCAGCAGCSEEEFEEFVEMVSKSMREHFKGLVKGSREVQ